MWPLVLALTLLLQGVRIDSRFVCQVVPLATGGAYTAKHCLDGRRVVRANGREYRGWTLDPDRDLAHVGGDWPGGVRVGPPPDVGSVGQWIGRTTGEYRYLGRFLTKVNEDPVAKEHDVWCWVSGSGPRQGDSGSGVYVDGALVGIEVAAGSRVIMCPDTYELWTIWVP